MPDATDGCPRDTGQKTGGYFPHRRNGEDPCRPCTDKFSDYLAERRSKRGRTTYETTCKSCGEAATVTEKWVEFCSNECWGAWKSAQAAEERAAREAIERQKRLPIHVGPSNVTHLPPAHPAMQDPPPGTWWTMFVAGPCQWCRQPFTAPATSWDTRSLYCSRPCARGASRSRRGRFSIPPDTRQQIYARDNWNCQLCGRPVDQDLDPSHQWAATLDHIVPQSWTLIPDHRPDNLRLAHRWCNSVRSDERNGTSDWSQRVTGEGDASAT